jgi:hypothetical protein
MGLRILSLGMFSCPFEDFLTLKEIDGGGTRGLSTLYVLREMMNRVVPNNGGDIRPSEYFDIIGASGPNALLALLFVRFVRHG